MTPEQAAANGRALRERFEATPAESRPIEWYTELRELEDLAGQVDGKLYIDWILTLNDLRSNGEDAAAEALLWKLVTAAERAADVSGREPAPAYTERLAIIMHRQSRYAEEVALIERWEAACPPERRGPGTRQSKLAKRLAKARVLNQA